MNKGICYIVATPIGHLSDMTYRAVSTLNEVDIIYAEDTRTSKVLLNHYEIKTALKSYHKHNEMHATEIILNDLLEGKNIALISDAGTPRISDPGDILIKSLNEHGIKVVPIPGASAILTALMASPFSLEEFTFIGFIPTQKKKQKELFKRIKHYPSLLVFYEAPHRINATLNVLYEHLNERTIFIGREMTKKFETFEIHTLSPSLILDAPRGEYVIIVKGDSAKTIYPDDYIEHIEILLSDGQSEKEAIKHVASLRNVSKNEVYMAYQRAKKGSLDE